MSQEQRGVIGLVLVGLVAAGGGILGNVAAGEIPASLTPYLWWAWPLFALFTVAGIVLELWSRRSERNAAPADPDAVPTPAPATDPAAAPLAQRAPLPDGYGRREMIHRLEERTSNEDLKTLCFDLGLNHEDFPQEHRAFARELLLRLEREQRIPELLEELRAEMPWVLRDDATAEPATPPAPDGWRIVHPYFVLPHFMGRAAERAMLSAWLEADDDHPLLVLRAVGGFGKSALAWHWLHHDVARERWPRVLWWSFYESEARFEHFLEETLAYLGVAAADRSPRERADLLIDQLRQPGTLLVLDGFERELRAYASMAAPYQGDEITPLPISGEGQTSAASQGEGHRDTTHPAAEHFLRRVATMPGLRGKLLMTSRLLPRALEHQRTLLAGCRDEALTALSEADAVAFFRAHNIAGTTHELARVAERYGHHPLSLRLLAGVIVDDPAQPGDIAVAEQVDVSEELKQRQTHVLAFTYGRLSDEQRTLLGRIACFRSGVAYETLQGLTEDEATLRADLRRLRQRGLLHREAHSHRYDLHPIVRGHAYRRLTAPQRRESHAQLRTLFEDVPTPARMQRLEELEPVIELYHHTVRAGQYDEAFALFRDRLSHPLYYQFGAYELRVELLRALFPDGEGAPRRLSKESDQAWTLNGLANSYSLSGQPRRAVPLLEQAAKLEERASDKNNLAIGLGNLAQQQLAIGRLRDAEANLRRSIALCQAIDDEFREAVGHQELGRLLTYRGAWAEAEAELAISTRYWEKSNDVQGLCLDESYRALRALLMAREHSPTPHVPLVRRHKSRVTTSTLSRYRERVASGASRVRANATRSMRWNWRRKQQSIRTLYILCAISCVPTGCWARRSENAAIWQRRSRT